MANTFYIDNICTSPVEVLRIKMASEVVRIKGVLAGSSSKLRIRKSGVTYGIPLLTTDASKASPIRFYDGTDVKSLEKI